MKIFETPGRDNTQACIDIAIEKASELKAPIVAASYTGYTALALLEALKEKELSIPLIVVRGTYGHREPGTFRMDEETEQSLIGGGARIVSATHALSGAERGLSRKFSGIYPVEIIAYTLRMLGQGTKVCVECSVMALDAGLLSYGQPVVAVGGTGKGCDTCVLITPAHANEILSTKIHEIYCKPSLL